MKRNQDKNHNNRRMFVANITVVITALIAVAVVVCLNNILQSSIADDVYKQDVTGSAVNSDQDNLETDDNVNEPENKGITNTKTDNSELDVETSKYLFETTQGDDGSKMLAHKIILSVDKDADEQQVMASLESQGYKVAETLVQSDTESGAVLSIELPLDKSVEDSIEFLDEQEGIKDSEPDYLYEVEDSTISEDNEATFAAYSINDKYASELWALDATNAYNAWDIVRTNKQVSVAVIDTGVDYDHEDLADNMVSTYYAASTGTYGSDTEHHGSHVAGIAAAKCNNGKGVAGISYDAGIVGIDVSYSDSSGNEYMTTSSLLLAYNYIITNQSTYNIRVANMSIGYANGTMNTQLATLIDKAEDKGIITVCAAGNNDDTDPDPPYTHWPSDYESCVGVINVGRIITGYTFDFSKYTDFIVPVYGDGYERDSSSNYGEGKNISAPGTDIYSTTTGSSYESYSGTSMASPYVAGLAALIFAANPDLSVSQCKDILYSTATDMGDSGFDTGYGWGLINAEAAVKKAKAGGETHLWTSEEIEDKSYCKVSRYTCSYCGDTYDEKIEHNYESKLIQKQTCTQDYIMRYTCYTCGDTYDVTSAALGHQWGSSVVTKEPTCTEKGISSKTCTVCGDVETEDIDILGHSYSEGVVTKTPTCVDAGEKTYTCSVCGATKTEVIEATGKHTYETQTKEATCTQDGYKKSVCTVCGDVESEDILPALEHSYALVDSKDATCVEDGYKNYRCSNCGDTHSDVTKATGHKFGEPQVTREPGCVDAGERTYACSVCNATKTEPISASGHKYDLQTKEATCGEAGYKKSVCTVCGDVEDEEILPALEHSYTLVDSKDATCVEDGYKNYRCSNCGDTHSDVTKATGHKFGEPQVTREPGCVDAGERTYTCSICNETKTEVIEATGHTDNWTVVKEPKLGYIGKEENHCKTCNTLLGSRDVDSLATWNRLAGESRYDTAAEIASEYIGDSTCDYVIIASGENFPDALAASYASGMLDAPIILTSSSSLSPQSKQQIQNSGATKAIIIGGEGAISGEVKSQIEDIDNIKEVTRIAGSTRISTAEEIYKQVFKIATGTQTSKIAILASANNYPDALSASPISYVEHSPIFLTGSSSLENSTLEILTSRDFDEVIIAGGTGAISSDIENTLENAGLGVTRLSGTSRYDTCLAIANYALDNNILTTDSIAIASGNNFPDALAGAALCGKTKSILLITDKSDTNCDNSNDVSRKLISNSRLEISNVYLFGGTGAVPTDLENFLRGL